MWRRRIGTGYLVLLGLLLGGLVGCTLGGVGKEGELQYVAPFEHEMSPGETLPGTGIRYLEKVEDGARLLIGDQEALRKVGDSLEWESQPLDGVRVHWLLRVALFSQAEMRVIGTVTISAYGASPVPGEPDTRSELQFSAPVTLHAGRDQAIPGTTITYLGSTDQGAQLGNVEGFAYRKVADSITWEGRLKDRLSIRFALRVVFYTDDRLQTAGTATLWIGP